MAPPQRIAGGILTRMLDLWERSVECLTLLAFATAILDRLLHRSQVPNVQGQSYRLRDFKMEVSLRT